MKLEHEDGKLHLLHALWPVWCLLSFLLLSAALHEAQKRTDGMSSTAVMAGTAGLSKASSSSAKQGYTIRIEGTRYLCLQETGNASTLTDVYGPPKTAKLTCVTEFTNTAMKPR